MLVLKVLVQVLRLVSWLLLPIWCMDYSWSVVRKHLLLRVSQIPLERPFSLSRFDGLSCGCGHFLKILLNIAPPLIFFISEWDSNQLESGWCQTRSNLAETTTKITHVALSLSSVSFQLLRSLELSNIEMQSQRLKVYFTPQNHKPSHEHLAPEKLESRRERELAFLEPNRLT